MLNQDPKNIIFRHGGTNMLTLPCMYVKFGIELVGEVDEELDFTLTENYENMRLLIELKVRLWLADALWMQGYIFADDKYLHIDSHVLMVVNDFKKLDFDLWANRNFAAEVEMKFKKKDIGMPAWAYPAGGYIAIAG